MSDLDKVICKKCGKPLNYQFYYRPKVGAIEHWTHLGDSEQEKCDGEIVIKRWTVEEYLDFADKKAGRVREPLIWGMKGKLR